VTYNGPRPRWAAGPLEIQRQVHPHEPRCVDRGWVEPRPAVQRVASAVLVCAVVGRRVVGVEQVAQIDTDIGACRSESEDLREAVILRDLEEFTYEEIAGMLNVPVGTVKSRINRGRLELARVLKK